MVVHYASIMHLSFLVFNYYGPFALYCDIRVVRSYYLKLNNVNETLIKEVKQPASVPSQVNELAKSCICAIRAILPKIVNVST